MTNKYLTKIAKTDIAASNSGLDNTPTAPRATLLEPIKALPTLAKEAGIIGKAKDWIGPLENMDKLKLGLSGTGLALGTAGFVMNQKRMANDEKRRSLEAQSLATLKKIHESLAIKDKSE